MQAYVIEIQVIGNEVGFAVSAEPSVTVDHRDVIESLRPAGADYLEQEVGPPPPVH